MNDHHISNNCETCGRGVSPEGHPPSYRIWCSVSCGDQWKSAHPEDVANWIAIEELTLVQRAELDALIGQHAGAA